MAFGDERPCHTEEACARLLDRFLLEPEVLLDNLAPEGWAHSPLRRFYHPTPEQVRGERLRARRNLASLPGRPDAGSDEAAEHPGAADHEEGDGNPAREIVEILGRALWDVFSENHHVVDAEGVEYDLGSFRGSAGFIAEAINRRYPRLGAGYDYLDFYMVTLPGSGRADLAPVYRWIFEGLKAAGCRWIYTFPRLHAIDFRPLLREDDALSHDPSEAVRAELEEEEHAREFQALRERFDRWAEEDSRKARHQPLPRIVVGYRDVYGALPEGWPHPDM